MNVKELQEVLQDLKEIAQKDRNRQFRSTFKENPYNICKLCGNHIYANVEICENCGKR